MTETAVARHEAPSDRFPDLHAGIGCYYTAKVERFGASPLGVDWTCEPTQQLRFIQILKVVRSAHRFSINDLGCGYGALLGFLDKRCGDDGFDYLGIDLSVEMVRRARRKWRGRTSARFIVGHSSPRVADYTVASGIFNVVPSGSRDSWEALVATTLTDMAETSRSGFSVNFLRHVEGSRPEGLYQASADFWSRFCVNSLKCDVDVLADYGMREFTLIARKR